MRKINNALSAAILLIFLGISAFAQSDLINNNTTSPYSRFGLGDLHHYGYGRTAAMGGASLGSRRSVQINSANPASYNSNDSLSFIFDFGFDATFSSYKSSSGSLKTDDINFRYFSLSFPITKSLGAAMGIQPYSDMGYEVAYTDDIDGVGNVYHNYFGDGSTSKAYFGAAFSPFKGLSLGANLNYIFGMLNKNTRVEFSNSDVFFLSNTESTRLRDFTLNYGLQYDVNLGKNKFLTLGATFENKSNFTALHNQFYYRGLVIGTELYRDTLVYVSETKDLIKMPSTFGVGISYSQINKLEINADYYHASWSKATFFGQPDALITDQNRISFGVEYIPEAFSIRSYLKRVKYRIGLHQESSYLKLNNHQIKEFGISFGAGLPFPKSKSTANFAIELGKKGTMTDNLVRNNYAKFSIYLNLYDYWFMKSKFD